MLAGLTAAIVTHQTPTLTVERTVHPISSSHPLTSDRANDYKTCSNYRINPYMTDLRATFSRGQLAQSTGVKGETIRYYENCGLLDAPARTAGGHRIYTDDHVGQLKFIRRCRGLGFGINEIDGLLGLADSGEKTCRQVRQATVEHLNGVQDKIKDLRKMERSLKDLIGQCELNSSPDCPIIDVLFS